MSMTRAEALTKLTEMRDFAEQMEKDVVANFGPAAKHAMPFGCIYITNSLGPVPRTIHVHITAEMLNHCVTGIEDSIRILAEEDVKDIGAIADALKGGVFAAKYTRPPLLRRITRALRMFFLADET